MRISGITDMKHGCAWFGQVHKHNSACCRQGHTDLTRTISDASDAAGRHKHIEPIDRIGFPSARAKSNVRNYRWLFTMRLLSLLALIMHSQRKTCRQADVHNGGTSLNFGQFTALCGNKTHNVKIIPRDVGGISIIFSKWDVRATRSLDSPP